MHTAVRQNFARLVCFCTTGVLHLEHNDMFQDLLSVAQALLAGLQAYQLNASLRTCV